MILGVTALIAWTVTVTAVGIKIAFDCGARTTRDEAKKKKSVKPTEMKMDTPNRAKIAEFWCASFEDEKGTSAN